MYSKQHQEIDSQYQEKLENQKTFEVDNRIGNKPTYYVLDMFAYPSGVGLHLGHALTYTATDIRARSMRLLGYEVLYPVGFDSFGLPTENFAMKVGKSAQRVTTENTDNFREQLKKLAISYDWNREIITSDKDYYKWTQWLVLKLWEHGLLYKKLAPVNWCPNCQTVLANEQVVHGKCERDDAPVEQRQMEQWFVNITKYADELVDGLDQLDWPEESKKMQKNWIGRREGFEFSLINDDGINIGVFVEKSKFNRNIEGVAISIDHPLVPELAKNNKELETNLRGYSQNIKLMGAIDRYERYQERTGLFSGVYLYSTFSNQKIPLFISGNVSSISDADILYPHSQKRDRAIFDASHVNLEMPSNTQVEQSIEEQELLESTDQIKPGKRYRLRDWSISRQRYWGAPMPFLYSSDGTIIGVDEKDLPILLPENIQNYKPSGISPLEQVSEFANSIGKSGEHLKREVDTLDTFVDSAFYYLRYLNPKDSDNFISPDALEKWGDVDMYVGGKEHVTAHLIYARFIHKFLRDAGIVRSSEPFPSLRHQGVVLDSDGVKMSKRLGNVVNPIDVINKYGADTLRVYLMFMGPLSDPHMWDENGIEGAAKFLDKVSKLSNMTQDRTPTQDELNTTNKLIQEIKNDTLALKYNTAVSKFMVFVNSRLTIGTIPRDTFKIFLTLLNPYAPNLTDFLWKEQKFPGDIDRTEFPTLIENEIVDEKLCNLVVQINGKTRGVINNTSTTISEENVLDMIKVDDRFSKYIGDQIIKNTIYRAGKIINIVI